MYARLLCRLVAVIAFVVAIFAAVPACEVTSRWPPTVLDAGVADSARPDLPYRMPTNIVPNTIPSIVTTLPAPNDGEIANSASLTQFVTPLVDDTEAFRLLTYGGGMRRRVVGQNSTTMTIYPLGAVVLQTGGTWKVYAHTVSTAVNPTTLAGGALAVSTRYWIYAYDNAGVLDFTASTTGPDANFRYMAGNTAYFFVSTFDTDPGGSLVAYSQTDLKFSISTSQPILNAGSSLLVVAIPLGVSYPAQATRIAYRAQINATAASRYADIIEGGYIKTRLIDDGTVETHAQGWIDISAAGGTLSYQVSNAAVQLTVYPEGFWL